MNLLLIGAGGKMGRTLINCIYGNEQFEILGGVDKFAKQKDFTFPIFGSCKEIDQKVKIDCIIDFSAREAIYDYLPYAVENNIPCVIATTGYDKDQQKFISDAADKIAIFKTGNMSVGINLLLRLVKIAARTLGQNADVEIVETHHNQKVDAPSGTALLLADGIKESLDYDAEYVNGRCGQVGKRGKEIGIHAVRGGTVVGKHEVSFFLNNEVITLKHEAENKSVFAYGALEAAKYLVDKPNGLYDMNDLLS